MRRPALAWLVGSSLALPGLSALAHEDDPKILDRQRPRVAAAYRGKALAHGFAPQAPGAPAPPTAAATEFPASGVALLSWLPLAEFGSSVSSGADCWGWTSPSGREYALMTTSHNTAVVEVTQPDDAQIIAILPGPQSLWRDVKTYQHYAYVVSEGGDGIQVFDLSNVDAGIVTTLPSVTTGGTTATHNVAIDEVSGYLYRCGGSSNGLRVYSLANPASPAYVGSWSDRYVHDAQIVTIGNKQYAFAATGDNGGFDNPSFEVIDVTNKNNMTSAQRIIYGGGRYSHQIWLSEDLQYAYLNDELDEDGSLPTTTLVFDVSSPESATLVSSFTNGNTAVGHNLYTRGNLVFEANYRSGLRVFDATNPAAPTEVAYFDTYPENDAADFNGLWSNYPYFPSGIVIGSDLERGLFVWWVGDPLVTFSYPNGLPAAIDPAGDSVVVDIAEANPGDLAPNTAMLHWDSGLDQGSVPLVALGGGSYRADFPAIPCGLDVQYYFTADSTNGLTWADPVGEVHETVSALAILTVASYDMEANQGWSAGAPGDDASTGIWERGDPVGTAAQPSDDHTPGGSDCWFTGQGSVGGSVGENDVDGGKTTLLSPVLDLSNALDPAIEYWRWYSNSEGASPNADVFVVDISGDGGQSWTNVETVGPDGSQVGGLWHLHTFRVADLIAPTNQVQLRFIASDEGDGSIVEAAVDDLTVFEVSCPDCNQNGVSDGLDIAGGSSLDLDADGQPDECQPLSADTGSISLASGGQQSFTLDAGAAFGQHAYVVLGSATGTSPGLPVDGVTVPLNFDAYTAFSIKRANGAVFVNTFGALDGQGKGSAQLKVPGGTDPSLAGLRLHHAYPAFDLVSGAAAMASNAIPVDLVP